MIQNHLREEKNAKKTTVWKVHTCTVSCKNTGHTQTISSNPYTNSCSESPFEAHNVVSDDILSQLHDPFLCLLVSSCELVCMYWATLSVHHMNENIKRSMLQSKHLVNQMLKLTLNIS